MQARLGLLFLFLLFLAFLANLSPSGNNAVSSRLGLVAASRFAHNWLTQLQQGLPGASVVSVSLPGSQNRTQALTEPSLVSSSFSSSFSRWQHSQLALQVVIYRLVNG